MARSKDIQQRWTMMSTTNRTLQLKIRKLLLLAACISVITTFAMLVPSPAVCNWDFRGSLWGPAYMLLNGQTPYSFDTPYGPYPGIWMPQLIGAFFLIGLLPCFVAAKIWFITEIAGLFLMIWLIAGRKLPPPILFGMCLLLIFFFPPLYTHFAFGQITILITIFLMLVVFQSSEENTFPAHRWWVPLLLALALAKPQLGVLAYPGLLVSTYRHRGVGAAAKLVLLTAGWIALFIVPVTLLDPGWLKGFLDITLGNIDVLWYLPTPFVQLRNVMGTTGIVLWALLFLLCLCIVLWLWVNQNAKLALLWSLALTPIATPYSSSWDFMLMVPFLLWLFIHMQSRLARMALLLGTFLIDFLQVATRFHSDIPDGRNWWVPIALMAVFLLAVTLQRVNFNQTRFTF